MPSRLFYVWLVEEADAEAEAQAAAVLADVRLIATVRVLNGCYSINVEGPTFRECDAAARGVAMRLQKEGGFCVGKNRPFDEAEPVVQEVAPPPKRPRRAPSRRRVMSPPRANPVLSEATTLSQNGQPVVPRSLSSSQANALAGAASAALVLAFLQTTYMHEVTFSFLCDRIGLGRRAVKPYLKILVDRGLVEALPRYRYRLTDQGRQVDVGHLTD